MEEKDNEFTGGALARAGFTLIELAIVLVVISLIVAGVVSGLSIVRAAKVNSQVAQFKKFEVAYNNFRLAYDAIPGDMSNASSYWGAATDGNGNGQMEDTYGYNCAQSCGQINNNGEKVTFFHHLYLAGMVPEAYTGTGNALSNNIGAGVPAAAFDSSVYLFTASRFYHSTSFGMDVANPNALTMGVFLFASAGFSPYNMAQIDRKMDDGFPASGRLWAIWNSGCSTATTPMTYLTTLTPGCGAQYLLAK